MIIVCSVYDMPTAARDARATHVVSLIQADEMPDTPADPPGVRHLKIDMHDITEPVDGMILPSEGHVAELIDFAAGWNRQTPMIVHCHMGISRSMTAALTLLCLDRPGEELQVGRRLRRQAAHAQPNRLIVSHADTLLGRQGRLLDALDAMGPRQSMLLRGPVTRIALDPDQ